MEEPGIFFLEMLSVSTFKAMKTPQLRMRKKAKKIALKSLSTLDFFLAAIK
jgi:hypothetical protein